MNSTVKILMLCLLMAGCKEPDKVVIPADVIPEKEMISVLTDIHIVEGAKVSDRIMGDTLKADIYFEKVYQKHHISEEKFEKSFTFYSNHPGIMNSIYEKVIENLNKMETIPPRVHLSDENKTAKNSLKKSLLDSIPLGQKKLDSIR